MGIAAEQQKAARHPVLKRRAIGETFVGGIVRMEQRQLVKDGAPQFHPDGRPKQELVVTLLAQRTDMIATSNRVEVEVGPDDVVRLILKGGGFSQWIDAANAHKAKAGKPVVEIGDLVRLKTTHAIRYRGDSSGTELGRIDTQEALEEYESNPRNLKSETLGFRGTIALREPDPSKPGEAEFLAECEALYHELDRQHIPAEPATTATRPAYAPAPAADDEWDDDDDAPAARGPIANTPARVMARAEAALAPADEDDDGF